MANSVESVDPDQTPRYGLTCSEVTVSNILRVQNKLEGNTVDSRYLEVQGTSKILRDISTSTYLICRIKEKINRTATYVI